MYEWNFPETNLPWLKARTVFLTVYGSHAYGTNRAGSDLDVRGVCMPPSKYYHGYLERFEQAEFKGVQDAVIYEIRKFFKLAADCNPNALEILFTDPRHHIQSTLIGDKLLANRDRFLSRKAKHTFSGYAISQLKRISLHRRWLLDPPKEAPTRAAFNLPERTVIPADQLAVVWAGVRAKLEEWDPDLGDLDEAGRIAIKERYATAIAEQRITVDNQWMAAARTMGVNENFILLMDCEKRFNAAQTEWAQYQNWKKQRNPARAELEAKYGYDTKHGMHLVRLLRMGREVLDGKGLVVFRPDREELGSIRDGAWDYDRLMAWALDADKAMTEAVKTSPLPWGPDHKELDKLCQELVELSLS